MLYLLIFLLGALTTLVGLFVYAKIQIKKKGVIKKWVQFYKKSSHY